MVPERLSWLMGTEAGAAWLESLPRLLDECRERWGLEVGEPYAGSYVALVVPVSLPTGKNAVLKIQFPHRESEHEAAALEVWGGNGAVRLLDYDTTRHALLLERCTPGTHLAEQGADEALRVMIELLPRLWVRVDEPFSSLATEALLWAEHLPSHWERAGKPFERGLVDAAVDRLRALSGSQGEQVLLHQDLHADNVLRAEREPWLVIDPKPLIGEREFSVAPIVRAYELGHRREFVRHRFDRLTSELGLDRDRARDWTFAQTIAWAFEGDEVLVRHVETARWLLE